MVFRQNVYGFLDSEAEPEDPGTFSYRDMEVRDNRQVDIVFVRVGGSAFLFSRVRECRCLHYTVEDRMFIPRSMGHD